MRIFTSFQSMVDAIAPSQKDQKSFFLLSLALALVFFLSARIQPMRIGDGSEYYALFIAWKNTLRPWMTPEAFGAYDRYISSGEVFGFSSLNQLADAFPSLRVGSTHDFNHFWFYSFAAFLTSSFVGLLGLHVGIHNSFVMFHWILSCLLFWIAYHRHGRVGLVVTALLTFGSPMLWYLNKVHTEFFTYSLLLSGTILVMSARYVGAALLISVASTQNPTLAALALLLLGIRVAHGSQTGVSWLEVIGAFLVLAIITLHPSYYFFRYGVPTPQLLAGGASPGAHWKEFYVWLLDPDLGLLPNWPLGVGLIVAAMSLLLLQRLSSDHARPIEPVINCPKWVWRGYVVTFIVVCLYTHSSTTHMNSGATPGFSRYALWYIPLFYPMLRHVVDFISQRRIFLLGGIGASSILLIDNALSNDISRPDAPPKPTGVSVFVQTEFGTLYDPPVQVFLERYGTYWKNSTVAAVVGPDCRKVLLIPGNDRNRYLAPPSCGFSISSLSKVLSSKVSSSKGVSYHRMTAQEADDSRVKIELGHPYLTSASGDGVEMLESGWSAPEPWGTWTDGDVAVISLPCDPNTSIVSKMSVTLRMTGLVLGVHRDTRLAIEAAGKEVWRGVVSGAPIDVSFKIPGSACARGSLQIRLLIQNPASPRQLVVSADPRKLGIGLHRLIVN